MGQGKATLNSELAPVKNKSNESKKVKLVDRYTPFSM